MMPPRIRTTPAHTPTMTNMMVLLSLEEEDEGGGVGEEGLGVMVEEEISNGLVVEEGVDCVVAGGRAGGVVVAGTGWVVAGAFPRQV